MFDLRVPMRVPMRVPTRRGRGGGEGLGAAPPVHLFAGGAANGEGRAGRGRPSDCVRLPVPAALACLRRLAAPSALWPAWTCPLRSRVSAAAGALACTRTNARPRRARPPRHRCELAQRVQLSPRSQKCVTEASCSGPWPSAFRRRMRHAPRACPRFDLRVPMRVPHGLFTPRAVHARSDARRRALAPCRTDAQTHRHTDTQAHTQTYTDRHTQTHTDTH